MAPFRILFSGGLQYDIEVDVGTRTRYTVHGTHTGGARTHLPTYLPTPVRDV